MAAPNIVAVATITGKTAYAALTTSAASILSNAASSGKLFRVNTILVSNVDGTNAADVTVSYYTAAAIGGTAYKIASTITVPADATIVILDKNSVINLEEDRSIGALASATGDLEILISYEEIS